MQKERIEYLDVAKGIVMLLVILGHCFVFSIYGWGDNSIYLYKNPMMNILKSIDMPVFIFISGIFSKKMLDTKSYWIKKIKHLILPLFLIPLLLNLYYNNINGLILGTTHAGYWFTWALFLMLIPFFIVRKISDNIISKYKNYIELALFILSYILINKIYTISNQNIIGIFSLNYLSWLYPFLILGYLFSTNDSVKRFFTNELVICVSFIFYTLYMSTYFNLEETQLIKNFPVEVSGVICVLSIAKYIESKHNKINEFLSYIGKISLPIYFLHYIFLFNVTMFIPNLEKFGLGETMLIIVLGIILTAIVLSFTLITYNIICSNRYLHKLLFGTDIPK